MIDRVAPTDEFSRIVKGTNFLVQIDNCNPLYLRTGQIRRGSLFSDRPEGSSDPVYELEHVNTVYVNFPKIDITATSDQYCAIFDIINNLLLYNDPTRKRRNDQLSSMVFAMHKDELVGVSSIISKIQDRIRYMEILCDMILCDEEFLHRMEELYDNYCDIKERISTSQQELLLIMDALKLVALHRQHRSSAAKNQRTIVNAKELAWSLITEDKGPLCDLTLHDTEFYRLGHEDRSENNTLQINQLLLKNRVGKPFYDQVMAPYIPDGRDINFSRHKMLRVYWRALAPVAGIGIVDHFEVNIFPLMLQLEYEVAKGLIEYLYPQRLKNTDPKKSDRSNAGTPVDERARSNTSVSMDLRVASGSGVGGPSAPKRTRSSTSLHMNDAGTSLSPQTARRRSNTISGQSQLSSASSVSDDDLAVDGAPLDDSQSSIDGTTITSSKRVAKRIFQRLVSGTNLVLGSFDLDQDHDVKLMKNRAFSNKTFVYIKVPGSTHCVSYHGEKEKNIEDLHQFVFKLPTLEYHNRTWTWLEFLFAVRKDIALAIFSQTGSLVREKLTIRKVPRLSFGKNDRSRPEDDATSDAPTPEPPIP